MKILAGRSCRTHFSIKMSKDSEKGKYSTPEGSYLWEYLTTFFCAICSFCVGTLIGWNSPSLAELMLPGSPISMSPGEASTLGASLSIGQMIAPPFSVFIIDRIGRKNSILLFATPMLVSWGLIAVAGHVTVLIAARIMAGFSIGLISCATPIYMGEILSANIRGSLSTISHISFTIGTLFIFVVAPYTGVRLTACLCMALTMCFLVCYSFAPESPYFLIRIGRVEEAEIALEKLRGKTDVSDELELIKATILEKGITLLGSDGCEKSVTTEEQSAFRQLFAIRGNMKAFLISMILAVFTHFCGYTAILNYCHLIARDMGTEIEPHVVTTVLGLLQVASSIIVVFIVDRVGRRQIISASGAVSGTIALTIGVYFYLIEYAMIDVRQYSIIPLCSLFFYMMSLNMGVISVSGIVTSEIFAPDIKTLANCISGIACGLFGVISNKLYLLVAISWGLGHTVLFFFYAASMWICTILLIRWLPETRGKTLLEIQRDLNA